MIKCILIDSNIWYHAYISSEKEDFQELHSIAKDFLLSKLADNTITIAITSYQMVEIMELLRKANVEKEKRKDLYESFMSEKFLRVEIAIDNVKDCFYKSLVSDIHIYDYLVAIPLHGIISEIYTADDHFQHDDFKAIATVTNPLSPWISREGKNPYRTMTEGS